MITVTKKLKENVTVWAVYGILALAVIYPIGHLFLSSFRIDRIGRPILCYGQGGLDMEEPGEIAIVCQLRRRTRLGWGPVAGPA